MAPSPPPTYNAATQQPHEESYINQNAVNRLGSAGVSIPGLGINRTSSSSAPNPWHDQPSSSTNPTPASSSTPPPAPPSSLQSRFSSLTTSPTPTPQPTSGTTLAQKQAALKTASSLRSDPTSVSLSDARATAATANNFRSRHGDQVASGWKTGTALNKKYGVAEKMGAQPGAGNGAPPAVTESSRFGGVGNAMAGFQKAAPPPPPTSVGARPSAVASPPPVPLSSKPRG